MNAPHRRDEHVPEEPAARSRICSIFAKPTGTAQFGWGWQCGERTSKGLFRYFYDCVLDARKHGFEVEFAAVAAALKRSTADDRAA